MCQELSYASTIPHGIHAITTPTAIGPTSTLERSQQACNALHSYLHTRAKLLNTASRTRLHMATIEMIVWYELGLTETVVKMERSNAPIRSSDSKTDTSLNHSKRNERLCLVSNICKIRSCISSRQAMFYRQRCLIAQNLTCEHFSIVAVTTALQSHIRI